jgi:hypothetical protein
MQEVPGGIVPRRQVWEFGMLSEVRRIIEDGPLGVRTFEQFWQACLQRAASGDREAVALFVFARLVQPFSDYYFDQALSEARAVQFRDRLLSAMRAYDDADGIEKKQAVLAGAIRDSLEDSER